MRKLFLLAMVYFATSAHTGSINHVSGWYYQSWLNEEIPKKIVLQLEKRSTQLYQNLYLGCKAGKIEIRISFSFYDLDIGLPLRYAFDKNAVQEVNVISLQKSVVTITDSGSARAMIERMASADLFKVEITRSNGFTEQADFNVTTKGWPIVEAFLEDCDQAGGRS